MEEKLPIIGYERALVNKLTKRLHNEARRWHDYGSISSTARGNRFEVRLADGRIARVEVTLDRIEEHTREDIK